MRRFLPSHSALLAFEAAARHMSFTRAAEELSITQSGVSRQIAALESQLGVKLFERMGSRLVLTEIARTYLEEISAALDRIERASVDCVRGRGLEGALVVGAPAGFAARWLAPRLGGFLAAAPDLMIELVSLEAEEDFTQTRLDIAVLRGRGVWTGARARALFPETLAVVAAPALAAAVPGAAEEIDFAALPTLQNASRPDLWLTWLRRAGRRHRGAIRGPRFARSEPMIAAACAGLGLAVLPTLYVETELASGALEAPFGAPVASEDSWWAVRPERRAPTAAALRFERWLHEEARRSRQAGG